MLLNISTALRLASMALTSLILVASAPIAPLDAETRILSCVHVDIPDSTVSESEKVSISIDPYDCNQSVLPATSWTAHLDHATYKNTEAVAAAYMPVPGMMDSDVHSPFPQEQPFQSFVSTTQPDYIQIQTPSRDGRDFLVDQSDPFSITTHTQQHDSEGLNIPPHPPTPQDPPRIGLPHRLRKRDGNKGDSTKSKDQVVLPSDSVAVVSGSVANDAKDRDILSKSVKNNVAPEGAKDMAPLSPEAQSTTVVPKAEANPPVDEKQPADDTPKPHYPNIPKDTTVPDPDGVPKTSGPNQSSPHDPVPIVPPEVGKAIPPKPTAKETFLKYAGAGAAILGTVGLGLGGVVGGTVGGTVGFLIGLFGAAINGAYRN